MNKNQKLKIKKWLIDILACAWHKQNSKLQMTNCNSKLKRGKGQSAKPQLKAKNYGENSTS